MPDNFIKDPQAVLDYKFDWSDWLQTGESISTRTVTVDTGLTKNSDVLTDSAKSVTVWVSGGMLGSDYKIVCRIVTDATPARTDERTMIIKVRNR